MEREKSFVFKNGQKVVFIGDSITDCGRMYENHPYGNGYVKIAIDLITAKYPERNITFINKGIGGNKVTDLYNRWYDDVIIHNPDWLSIKIGINDLHSYLNNENNGVSSALFEEVYIKILDEAKKKTKARLIMIGPFYMSLSNDKSPKFRTKVLETLPKYINIVHKLAKKYNAILVETHSVFQKQLKYRIPDFFCVEPVHPHQNGHTVIAIELLKSLNW